MSMARFFVAGLVDDGESIDDDHACLASGCKKESHMLRRNKLYLLHVCLHDCLLHCMCVIICADMAVTVHAPCAS